MHTRPTGPTSGEAEPLQRRDDGRLDDRPVVDDQRVVEAKSLISGRGGARVAEEILVALRLAGMALAAVGLHDEHAVDEEVDAADIPDPDLASHRDPEAQQPEPEERLEPALRVGTGDVDEPPLTCPQPRANLGPLRSPQKAQMPGRFEGGEERLVAEARGELYERLHDADLPERGDASSRCVTQWHPV